MWIKQEEYDNLLECKKMKTELEKEVQRLAELISAEVKDCRVGPWCKDCLHRGFDYSQIKMINAFGDPFIKETDGEVQYCMKHLHEICPEFETKKGSFTTPPSWE